MAQFIVYDKESGVIVFTHATAAAEGQPSELTDDAVLDILPAEAKLGSRRLGVLRVDAPLPSGKRVHVDPLTTKIVFSEAGEIGQTSSRSGWLAPGIPDQLSGAEGASMNTSSGPPDVQAVLKASANELRDWTAAVIAQSAVDNSYAHIQRNQNAVVARVSAVNPLLGYVVARFHETQDLGVLSAIRRIIPQLVAVADEVTSAFELDLTPAARGRLVQGLYEMTETETGDFDASFDYLRMLAKVLRKTKSIPEDAFLQALRSANDEFVRNPEDPVEVGDRRKKREKPHNDELTQAQLDEYEERDEPYTTPEPPEQIDRIPKAPNGGVYFRWTTVEWLPLINDKHDIYCHHPLNAPNAVSQGGDLPRLLELPGGYALFDKATRYWQGYVSKNWEGDIETEYWPDFPIKAQYIPEGKAVFVYTAVLMADQGDQLKWKDIEKLLKDKLNEKDTKDKLEKAIADGLEKVVEEVNFWGLPVGKLAGPAAGAAATALIQILNWLIDEIFASRAFRRIVVTHVTIWDSKKDSEPTSIVTWATSDQDNKIEELDPMVKDLGGATVRPLSAWQQTNLPKGLKGPAISWIGESRLPAHRSGHIPKEMKKAGFYNEISLRNTGKYAFYWPDNWAFGGHIFIPIFPISGGTDVANYALGLRTEVRIAELESQAI